MVEESSQWRGAENRDNFCKEERLAHELIPLTYVGESCVETPS